MSFKKAIQYLEGLPPEQRKFIAGAYSFKDQCCVIGRLVPALRLGNILYGNAKITSLIIRFAGVSKIVFELGMAPDEVEFLQIINDNFEGTPEQRFNHVLSWMKKQEGSPAQ